MAMTSKGKFGIALAIFGALLLAVLFFANPGFLSSPEPPAAEAAVDKDGSILKAEETAATQSAPVNGYSSAEPESVGLSPRKETTLLQRVTRKTASGERIVVLEAGDTVEVVTLRGSRIYLRTPEGETIGIPVEATDWIVQEEENPDR